MKKRMISLIGLSSVLVLLLSFVTTHGLEKYKPKSAPEKEALEVPLLVETGWLAQRGRSSKLRIIDYGRTVKDYQAGHIPGAVFMDRKAVWDKVNGIPGMLPSVDAIVEALEKAGVSGDNLVVIYDGAGGLWASRLFWALEYLGHRDVHILNGGWNKWVQEKRYTRKAVSVVSKGNFKVHVQPGLLATKEWVLENLRNPGVQVIDTRSPGEYTGEDVRAKHGGHIPEAIHINWISNLRRDDSKTFLPEEKMAELYESMKISKGKTVVTYCQTSVRGAHTYFVLRLLGYPEVRVYDGAWAEWGNAPETPIVTIHTRSPKQNDP